jgi:hypothetical protein
MNTLFIFVFTCCLLLAVAEASGLRGFHRVLATTLVVGDEVQWNSEDEDVPKGSTGKITECFDENSKATDADESELKGKCRVEFPTGNWSFPQSDLVLVSTEEEPTEEETTPAPTPAPTPTTSTATPAPTPPAATPTVDDDATKPSTRSSSNCSSISISNISDVDRTDLNGVYESVDIVQDGQPVYRLAGTENLMYYTTDDDTWWVSDNNLGEQEGFMYVEGESGLLGGGVWQVLDSDKEFHVVPGVIVTCDETPPPPLSSDAKAKIKLQILAAIRNTDLEGNSPGERFWDTSLGKGAAYVVAALGSTLGLLYWIWAFSDKAKAKARTDDPPIDPAKLKQQQQEQTPRAAAAANLLLSQPPLENVLGERNDSWRGSV